MRETCGKERSIGIACHLNALGFAQDVVLFKWPFLATKTATFEGKIRQRCFARGIGLLGLSHLHQASF
jgi:hypothetical protein